MIVKADAPEREELAKGDIAGSAPLQPYLSRRVVRMYRSLQRPNSVNSDVRRHLHRSIIDRYAEIHNPGVLIVGGWFCFQSGCLDVRHGVSRRIPRR